MIKLIWIFYLLPLLYAGYFCAYRFYMYYCPGDYPYQTEKTGQDEIARIKKQLGLEPHPKAEGAFKQMWKGERNVLFSNKTRHKGPRSIGTSIYILRVTPTCTQWYKHLSDQAFFWHAGGPLHIHMIHEDGSYTRGVLCDVTSNKECSAQVIIPHDTWYAAELEKGVLYNFCSEVVMPGFEFEDWFEGKQEDIIRDYPQHKDIIEAL